MEAVIKKAYGYGSLQEDPKSRGTGSREASGLAAVRLPSRHPGASWDLGPLDVVFSEAALATGWITASSLPFVEASAAKK